MLVFFLAETCDLEHSITTLLDSIPVFIQPPQSEPRQFVCRPITSVTVTGSAALIRIPRNVKHHTPVPCVTKHEYLNQGTISATLLPKNSAFGEVQEMCDAVVCSGLLFLYYDNSACSTLGCHEYTPKLLSLYNFCD